MRSGLIIVVVMMIGSAGLMTSCGGSSGDNLSSATPTVTSAGGVLADGRVFVAGRELSHCYVDQSKGEQKCFGSNLNGRLGDGTTSAQVSPVTITSASTGIKAIAMGIFSTCVIQADGSVRCWGCNQHSQLGGIASGVDCLNVPTNYESHVVSGLSNVTSLAGADEATCALLADGTVKCWGFNASKQLGNNSTIDSGTPVTVAGLGQTVKAISASAASFCALLADASVKCWGGNIQGALGNNSTIDSGVPVIASGLSEVSGLVGGKNGFCAVKADGSLYCWGRNSYQQIVNDVSQTNVNLPTLVNRISGVSQIAIGNVGMCALKLDGSVWCWGGASYGSLGNGDSTTTITTPYHVMDGVVAINAGSYSVCALSSSEIKCWGSAMSLVSSPTTITGW